MCPSLDLPENQKLRVLIVDDEPTLRLGFAYSLSNRTTVVETAANGRQALERLEVVPFDLIILDLRMPEIDGLGVIEQLRGRGSMIPVILCSAAMTPNATLRAIRAGVVDYLLKPVKPTDLRAMIEVVVQPGAEPVALAMKAARALDFNEAIRILGESPLACPRSRYWLTMLKTIRDAADGGEDEGALEEKLRTSLSTLAFNSVSSL